MEKKRYQVFVSSTYLDLKEARASVFDTLTKIDCIPAGMEIFPAFDEEQLEYIKAIIDDSDYYILIIAGRYGSQGVDGISFTEKEYSYAVSKGIPVLSFIHSAPDSIPVGLTDRDSKKQAKLDSFISTVRQGRLVQDWTDVSELSLKVTHAVMHSVKSKPGIGWIRGSAAASLEILNELNDLRKVNDALTKEIEKYRNSAKFAIPDLASLASKFPIRFKEYSDIGFYRAISICLEWKRIFSLVGPRIGVQKDGNVIGEALVSALEFEGKLHADCNNYILKEDEETIKLQLVAYGFVEISNENGRLALTELGTRTLLELKAVREVDTPSG